MHKNYYKAVAVMVGYIIGVGMFGLPYVAAKAGLFSFFLLLIVLGITQHFIHLIYANIIIETKTYHRMPGYAGLYLGKFWHHLVFVAKMIGNMGGLLAYIVITGIFLHQLLNPVFGGSEFFYASLIFFIEAIIVYFGIGAIARVELLMTVLLLTIVGMIAIKGSGAISFDNYLFVDWKLLFMPFGVMLFALDGNGSLPIVAKLIKKDKKTMRRVVQTGTIISMLVIAIFVFVIVGLSGFNTTQDALVGISNVLGGEVVVFALIFGIVTMFTSFIGVSESVRETLCWDYGIGRNLGWAMAVFIPYLMYLFGFKNLINIISFAGAIAGGISAIVLIMVFRELKKKDKKLALFKRKPANWLTGLLILMFIAGIINEIFSFIK